MIIISFGGKPLQMDFILSKIRSRRQGLILTILSVLRGKLPGGANFAGFRG